MNGTGLKCGGMKREQHDPVSGCPYIACEDYDFTWSKDEMKNFRQMWREGIPLREIAIRLRRHINEVAILVIDQAEKGYIKSRPGGVFGLKTQ